MRPSALRRLRRCIAACAAPVGERRAVEAGHHAGRREHRPGRAGAHGRRSAPSRLVAPHRAEHRGPPPHGDLARGQDRGDHPGPERLDRLHERGARGRPRRPARLLGRLPHHRLERPAAGDEHRALAGRRRELGAPARPGRPRRRAVVREQHGGDRARRTARRCRPSPARSARGSTPASRRRRPTTTTRRRSGSTATTRTWPRTRPSRTVMAWYSSASGHLGVLAQDVGADGSPVGSAPTMPTRATCRSACSAARRSRRATAAASTSPIRPATRRRTGSACGGSARRNAPLIARVAGSGSPAVAIAAAGDGRLWVLWTKGFGDPDVLATPLEQERDEIRRRRERRPPEGRHAGLQARRERRGRGARRARQLQHRHHLDRGHLLPADPARPDAAGPPAAGCAGASRPTCASPSSTPARPSRARRSRPAASPATRTDDGRVTLSMKSRKPVTARATHSGYTAATKRLGVRR